MMKKYLFTIIAFLPLVSQAGYLEASIPAELANAYMNRAIEILKNNPESDFKYEIVKGVETIRFLDIAEGYQSNQSCARHVGLTNANCVIRDYRETGGSLNDKSATLRRLSGVLWNLIPEKASFGWFGNKKLKNLSCESSPYSTGFCTLTDVRIK